LHGIWSTIFLTLTGGGDSSKATVQKALMRSDWIFDIISTILLLIFHLNFNLIKIPVKTNESTLF
jgi:hypothetical protein